MSTNNIERLKRLNELVELFSRKKHVIVLNPEDKKEESQDELDDDIVYDAANWRITDELSAYISQLATDNSIDIEDKILKIFEKICRDYVYDDNLISYIKKIDEDSFSLPDWYGRDVDSEWEKNRMTHNRRVCFELARYLAKACSELSGQTSNFNVCIHWNRELTHYVVGLTSDDYSIILDPDDFFSIKDLTRLKTNLTINGVKILDDRHGKFASAISKFNEGRSEYAIKRIQEDISSMDTPPSETAEDMSDEDIVFFSKAMEILSKKYNLDSQGIFEYMKEIADISIGAENREKIWKKIEGENGESTRYIRCLLLTIKEQTILLDVDEKKVRLFDREEFKEKRTSFIPYRELTRGNFDYYDGR